MRGSEVNVFLNMPFEQKGKYRDLLIAYVSGLTGLGFTPTDTTLSYTTVGLGTS
jgi:hypothetical protein